MIALLVFGPHADDIDIGLGGTVARHTAAAGEPLARGDAAGAPQARRIRVLR